MEIPYSGGEALTCGQIRELDILAIEHVGVPGLVLMENAGRNVAAFVYGLLADPPRSLAEKRGSRLGQKLHASAEAAPIH